MIIRGKELNASLGSFFYLIFNIFWRESKWNRCVIKKIHVDWVGSQLKNRNIKSIFKSYYEVLERLYNFGIKNKWENIDISNKFKFYYK